MRTNTGPFETASDGQYWYYFGTNGKKTVPSENGTNIKQKKINGTYYCLREDGAVQTGWVCVTGDESDNIEDYRLVDAEEKSAPAGILPSLRNIWRGIMIMTSSGFISIPRVFRKWDRQRAVRKPVI